MTRQEFITKRTARADEIIEAVITLNALDEQDVNDLYLEAEENGDTLELSAIIEARYVSFGY